MQPQKKIESGRFARLSNLKAELYAKFFEITEELGRLEADLEWERNALFESAATRKSEYMGQIEAAQMLHVSRAALSRGVAKHLECIAARRIEIGGKVVYPVAALERHWQNAVDKTASCDCREYQHRPESPLKFIKK